MLFLYCLKELNKQADLKHSCCFTLIKCGGPCHLSSFKQCSVDLICLQSAPLDAIFSPFNPDYKHGASGSNTPLICHSCCNINQKGPLQLPSGDFILPPQLYRHKRRHRESNLWPPENLGSCLPSTFFLVNLPLNACFGRRDTKFSPAQRAAGIFGRSLSLLPWRPGLSEAFCQTQAEIQRVCLSFYQ